ncbi:Import inner membrane translocase subunit [Pseudozyma hubeiensis]|nr:Import inner membrane translocase subunit [Pseudozyma hubeiensis]
MAFQTTLPRTASKHISSYGSVLDRFIVNHASTLSAASTKPTPSSSSSSSSTSSSSSSSSSSAASLFEPTKSSTTALWSPPRYSLRRQSVLLKQAALTSQLSLLPPSPKSTRLTQRLQRLTRSLDFERISSQYQYIPSTSPAVPVRPTSLSARSIKPSQRFTAQDRETALQHARQQVKDVGPYAGRAKVFKGSRVDKEKLRRKESVSGKLEAMDKTREEWRAGEAEARNKSKPGLPF